MTLSDLQSHSPTASFFRCYLSYNCAAVDNILDDIGPRPRLEGVARLEIPDKLLKPTFPPSPYIARTPHTPIKSPPLPGLVHWTISKGLSAGVQSRLDPCPQ